MSVKSEDASDLGSGTQRVGCRRDWSWEFEKHQYMNGSESTDWITDWMRQ